jgi:hypothetical protein
VQKDVNGQEVNLFKGSVGLMDFRKKRRPIKNCNLKLHLGDT